MMRRIWSWGIPLALALSAVWVVDWVLDRSLWLNEVESKATRELFNVLPPLRPHPDIMFVEVDSKSATELGEVNPNSPLDRRIYGQLALGLAKKGAKTLYSDIAFAAEIPEQDDPLREMLLQARKDYGLRTVLMMSSKVIQESPYEPDGFAHEFTISSRLRKGANDIAFGHALSFSPDGVLAGCTVIKDNTGANEQLWSVALLAAWAHLGLDPEDTEWDRFLLRNTSWECELGGADELNLIWTHEKSAFPSISMSEALRRIEDPNFRGFDGKLVLVVDSRNDADQEVVPKFGAVPGPLAMANLINTALTGRSKQPWWLSETQEWAYVALTAVMAAFGMRTGGRRAALWALTTPLLLGVALPFFAASQSRLILPPVWILSSALLTALGMATLLFFRLGTLQTKTAGVMEQVTVLFADIEDSTGLVQRLGAAEYQRQFESWLKSAESILKNHSGAIERTTGDGFMATFSGGTDFGCQNCLNSVRKMAQCESDLKASFGFESGPVSGGYVSEAGRKVWSTSGVTVNLARRIQGLAGQQGSTYAFGPIAARFLTDKNPIRSLGHHDLKGIDGRVECFTDREPANS